MPRLLRTATRTAVIAGTATAVSNNVSRRQAGRWAQQEQQMQPVAAPPPPAAAPPAPTAAPADLIGELTKLTALRDAGAINAAEFEAFKAKLLAG